MKRSTTRWTTAFAAAALLGVPAAGWAQTPPSSGSSGSSAPAQQQPAPGAQAQQGSAQEHIRQAQAALNDVQSAALPARSKQRVAELKRHLNAVEKSSAGAATTTTGTTASKTTARAKGNWATEVAAIDKILSELLGPATTSASGATGTTGSAGPAGTTGSRTATATLDETTRTKLMEVRTHVTAFAAAMSGTGAPGGKTPGEANPAETPEAAAAQPSTAPQSTPESGATASPAAAQQPEAGQAQPSQQAAGIAQADAEGAKRHLTGARDSLSQLTQLPAAAQLQGDARTQVSQLISNFNELITTNENWRASYDKVNANLTALIGAESATAEAAPPATGTPGAVGTSGTSTLDPAVRAKLVEFREHLVKFEKVASGSAGTSPQATQPQATQPQSGAMNHVEAIESILDGHAAGSGQAGATGTSGATAPAAGMTLDRTQVEQLRMHLAELKKIVGTK